MIPLSCEQVQRSDKSVTGGPSPTVASNWVHDALHNRMMTSSSTQSAQTTVVLDGISCRMRCCLWSWCKVMLLFDGKRFMRCQIFNLSEIKIYLIPPFTLCYGTKALSLNIVEILCQLTFSSLFTYICTYQRCKPTLRLVVVIFNR